MKFLIKRTGCDRVLAQLDRYSQSDLPSAQMREVELHLAACDPCRKELRALDQVLLLVEGIERPLPPTDLWARVSQEIARMDAAPARERSLGRVSTSAGWRSPAIGWRWPGAFAAVAAAAAVGMAAFISHPTPDTTPAMNVRTVSFVNQAEEAKFFDPLSDSASLGTMVEAVDRATPAARGASVHIESAMSGSGM
jgi:anti-sigma factor RsiW